MKTRDKNRKVYKFQTANGLVALAKESGLCPKDSGTVYVFCLFVLFLFCLAIINL